MKRCVIIGGGELHSSDRPENHITAHDFIIACDAGLLHAEKLGVSPDLIVGDFDSVQKPDTDTETIVLPCEKDDTDSFFAAKEGLKRGFDDFILLGMTGGRLDHTLGAISILEYLENRGAKAVIIGGRCSIRVISDVCEVARGCEYFSVFAIGRAEGVAICGAKYPLDNAVIESHYQYGISNEVAGDTAKISVKKGKLIVMEIYK